MKLIFTSIILLLFSYTSMGQSIEPRMADIDSLKTLIGRSKQDTNRVILLNKLAQIHFSHLQFTKGFLATESANKLSEKLKYSRGIGHYFFTMAAFHSGSRLRGYYYSRAEGVLFAGTSEVWREKHIPKVPKDAKPQEKIESLESSLSYFDNESHLEIQANIHFALRQIYKELNDLDNQSIQWGMAMDKFRIHNDSYAITELLIQKWESLDSTELRQNGRIYELEIINSIEESSDLRFKALLSYPVALTYFWRGHLNLAIEYFLKFQSYAESLNDKKLELRLNMMGVTYHLMGDSQKGYQALRKVMNVYESIKANEGINVSESVHQQAGYYYYNMTMALLSLDRIEEAKKYLMLSKLHGDKYPFWEHPGRYYLHKSIILESEEKYKEALLWSLKAFNEFKGNASFGIYAAIEVVENHIRAKEFQKALPYALKAYKSSTISQFKFFGVRTSLLVAETYNSLGRHAESNEYYKIHVTLRDKLESQNKTTQIEEAEIKFVLAGKEREVIHLENQTLINEKERRNQQLWLISISGALIFILIVVFILYRSVKSRKKANKILQEQKTKIEGTLIQLESSQAQLIQSEKMASLGELTAGIAHEIQNPLNFVNNFSEVSNELLEEMNEELGNGDIEEAKAISSDIKQNLEKINHHGQRASSIVKGMLEHSRVSDGKKEPTDINKLADEYLRLAYHGIRAKDKSFNADFKTEFNETLPKILVIPQDIGRVLLNLINNAFYACAERSRSAGSDYQPQVIVSTRKLNEKIELLVKDNGPGIPEEIKDKIFQPFFTTKPTGSGTGLGLSLAYDIIKAHGGTLSLESKIGEGTEFTIQLPNV